MTALELDGMFTRLLRSSGKSNVKAYRKFALFAADLLCAYHNRQKSVKKNIDHALGGSSAPHKCML